MAHGELMELELGEGMPHLANGADLPRIGPAHLAERGIIQGERTTDEPWPWDILAQQILFKARGGERERPVPGEAFRIVRDQVCSPLQNGTVMTLRESIVGITEQRPKPRRVLGRVSIAG